MTHDPMCPPQAIRSADPCHYCDLIARVREDATREVYRERLVFTPQQYDEEIAKVREDKATRAHRISEAYRCALRDAVEAVKALPAHGRVAYALAVSRDKAVAAIEALKGEQHGA